MFFLAVIVCLFLAFLYRFRGGGFVSTGSDTLCRFAWGGGLAVSYLVVSFPICWWFVPVAVLSGYAMMLIPHAFAQNYKNGRLAFDMWSMAWVGAARASLLFVPFAALTENYIGAVLAIALVAVCQPLAYLLGWNFPLNFPSLAKRSTEWAEFFTGAAWGLALLASTI